jgi:glycosyltransferase involved in cell wall biosynthesis
MKVAFSTYPMAFHTPGGGEVQLLQYKNYISQESIEVELLNPWKPEFSTFDLVHFFSCMGGSVHFCAFIKNIGLPLLVSPNLWITEDNKNLYPFDEIRTQFVLSDKVICNSNMECELLARTFNLPREKFETVYNGVDESFFVKVHPDLFRQEFNIDGPFILNVANLEPRKNQINLIKAMKSFPAMKLVLIGYERDLEYAKECIKVGGEQLLYIGPLPHDSALLKSAYAGCELFALPSTLETPGLAALEASAVGAKILITAEGCAREYFGEGATYVKHDDVKDIARGISIALSQPQTLLPTLVTRSNFTWSRVVYSLAGIYRNIVFGHIDQGMRTGFYDVEFDGHRLFAWSCGDFSFGIEPGNLIFLWRSVNGAFVDIYLDDVLLEKNLEVDTEWSRISLKITANSISPVRRLFFKINASSTKVQLGRDHGVAIAEVSLSRN